MFFLPEIVLSQRFGLHFEMRNLLYPPGIKQEGDKIIFRWGGTTHDEKVLVSRSILNARSFVTSYKVFGVWCDPREAGERIPWKGKTVFLVDYAGHCWYGYSDQETISLFDSNGIVPRRDVVSEFQKHTWKTVLARQSPVDQIEPMTCGLVSTTRVVMLLSQGEESLRCPLNPEIASEVKRFYYEQTNNPWLRTFPINVRLPYRQMKKKLTGELTL